MVIHAVLLERERVDNDIQNVLTKRNEIHII